MPERGAAGARAGRHNLPTLLTTFVGREAELLLIEELLGGHRLVTITGPGGCGKTRLSIEVGRRLSTKFSDGVLMVDLATVDAPDMLVPALALVLGVRQHPGLSLAESIAKVAGRRYQLLLIDNCEHVIDAAAEACDGLLRSGSDLRILGTSREPLGLLGEAKFRLPPLALPHENPAEGIDSCESVTLFCDRARLADPGFALDNATRPPVESLVRTLDGMPLAIELAAARLDVLTLRQLFEDLAGGTADLVNPSRGASTRQRSLTATIDWSFQLLSPAERRAFARLSIFAAPFTMAAAQAVLGPNAPELLASLVRRSLLVPPSPGPDEQDRYRMLETLRSFAADRLDDLDERDLAMRAWVRWVAAAATEVTAGFETSDETTAVRWIDAEHDNLVEALDWAVGSDPVAALDLTLVLAPWWLLRGHFEDGRTRLRIAVENGAPTSSDKAAAAHVWLGRLAHDCGDFSDVVDHMSDAAHLLDSADRNPLGVDAMNGTAMALLDLGRHDEAIRLAEQALESARALEYPSGRAYACTALTYACLTNGAFDAAVAWAREVHALDSSRVAGRALRWSRTALGDALAVTGELAEAERQFRTTFEMCRHSGDRSLAAMQLEGLARVAMRTGKRQPARDYLREAITTAGEIGDRLRLADCLSDLAVWLVPESPEAAATMWGAGRAISISIDIPRPRIAEITNEADPTSAYDSAFLTEPVLRMRDVLPPDSVTDAEQRGADLSIDEAIQRALDLLDDAAADPAPPRDAIALTPRERELVRLLAEGMTDQEIADRLFISVRTVRSHLDRVRDKTGARRRADLTRLALTLGSPP